MFQNEATDGHRRMTFDEFENGVIKTISPIDDMTIARFHAAWPLIAQLFYFFIDPACDLLDNLKKFVFYGSKGMKDGTLPELMKGQSYLQSVADQLRTELKDVFHQDISTIDPRIAEINQESILAARGQFFQYLHLFHASLGITGEGMEALRAVLVEHQSRITLRTPDAPNLHEEGGDTAFYAAYLARALNSSFEQMCIANNAKLSVRYKEGFNSEAADNRDLSQENAAMAGVYDPAKDGPLDHSERDE